MAYILPSEIWSIITATLTLQDVLVLLDAAQGTPLGLYFAKSPCITSLSIPVDNHCIRPDFGRPYYGKPNSCSCHCAASKSKPRAAVDSALDPSVVTTCADSQTTMIPAITNTAAVPMIGKTPNVNAMIAEHIDCRLHYYAPVISQHLESLTIELTDPSDSEPGSGALFETPGLRLLLSPHTPVRRLNLRLKYTRASINLLASYARADHALGSPAAFTAVQPPLIYEFLTRISHPGWFLNECRFMTNTSIPVYTTPSYPSTPITTLLSNVSRDLTFFYNAPAVHAFSYLSVLDLPDHLPTHLDELNHLPPSLQSIRLAVKFGISSATGGTSPGESPKRHLLPFLPYLHELNLRIVIPVTVVPDSLTYRRMFEELLESVPASIHSLTIRGPACLADPVLTGQLADVIASHIPPGLVRLSLPSFTSFENQLLVADMPARFALRRFCGAQIAPTCVGMDLLRWMTLSYPLLTHVELTLDTPLCVRRHHRWSEFESYQTCVIPDRVQSSCWSMLRHLKLKLNLYNNCCRMRSLLHPLEMLRDGTPNLLSIGFELRGRCLGMLSTVSDMSPWPHLERFHISVHSAVPSTLIGCVAGPKLRLVNWDCAETENGWSICKQYQKLALIVVHAVPYADIALMKRSLPDSCAVVMLIQQSGLLEHHAYIADDGGQTFADTVKLYDLLREMNPELPRMMSCTTSRIRS